MINRLDVKENYEHALDVALLMFSVLVSLGFPYTADAFFPKRLKNHCQGLRCSFS
jgi:hypothetical protein